MSILVNGSSTDKFFLQKGLRYGDPLSPFLFLIVTEGLSCPLKKAEVTRAFDDVQMGKEKILKSHSQLADDTTFLGRASVKNAKTMKRILRLFEIASGLKVNFHKSSLRGTTCQ